MHHPDWLSTAQERQRKQRMKPVPGRPFLMERLALAQGLAGQAAGQCRACTNGRLSPALKTRVREVSSSNTAPPARAEADFHEQGKGLLQQKLQIGKRGDLVGALEQGNEREAIQGLSGFRNNLRLM